MMRTRLTATGAAVALIFGAVALPSAIAAPVTVDRAPTSAIDGPRATGASWGMTTDRAGRIYASSFDFEYANDGTVEVFAAGAKNDDAPLRSISGSDTGLNAPLRPYVDAAGYLYVPNSGRGEFAVLGTVTVYAPTANGNAKPAYTLQVGDHGITEPSAIAVGPDGNLYVSDAASPTVAVFAPGARNATPPLRTIKLPTTVISSIFELAFSPSGESLYVVNYSESGPERPQVAVVPSRASGTVAPTRVITRAGDGWWPGGLAVDSSGNLYVADYNDNEVLVFDKNASGDAEPAVRLSGPSTDLSGPWSLVLDANRNLLVGNWDSGAINRYAPLVPFAKPTAVRSLRVGAVSKAKSRTITWAAPASNGGAPVSYRVLVKRGSKTILSRTTTGSSVTLKRDVLRAGKHTVSVTATNRVGAAPTVAAGFSVAKYKATKVRSLKVTGKSSSKTRLVKWNPPAWDGGTKIKSYRLVIKHGKLVYATKTLKPSAKRVVRLKTNLMALGKYKVTVRAKTAKGYGATATKSFKIAYF